MGYDDFEFSDRDYSDCEYSDCDTPYCDCNKRPVPANATCDPLPPPASNAHEQTPVSASATCDPLPHPNVDTKYCSCLECSTYYPEPVSATETCDALPQPTSTAETSIRKHLEKLAEEMWIIHAWESRDGNPPDNHIKYPDYLAFNLTRPQIIDYMLVFKDCLCCRRHTGDASAPSLPKTNGGIGDYCHEDACECNCRHLLRKLNDALTISLS